MMNQFGLFDYLCLDPAIASDGSCKLYEVGSSFYTPGFWVSMASLLRSRSVAFEEIRFLSDETRQYSRAIMLPVALGGEDLYPHVRGNEGKNYSGLVLLEDRDATDRATQAINDCIRTQCDGSGLDSFVRELCSVVGDLHDNVWSHGMSTGFSMFQRWKKPYSNEDVLFEFSLADCGLGFLRELKRVGLDEIGTHQSAIDWCIRKGCSSKLISARGGDWAQRLPPDMMGNPIPGIGAIRETENHHQGLGLAKLIKLIEDFHGELCLSTGDSILSINHSGDRVFSSSAFPWSGVAISCRFDTSLVRSSQDIDNGDRITEELLSYLRG